MDALPHNCRLAAPAPPQIRIPTTHIDKSILQFLCGNFFPLPNGLAIGNGDTGIFSFAAQEITPENYFTIRFDHKFSDSDSIYATYIRDNSTTIEPGTFGELVLRYRVQSPGRHAS